MSSVVEIAIALIAVAAVALMVSRLPDTRERLGEEFDDALYRGSVRALWYAIAITAVALLIVWLVV